MVDEDDDDDGVDVDVKEGGWENFCEGAGGGGNVMRAW